MEGFSVRIKPSVKGFSVVKYPNKQYFIGEVVDGAKNGEGYFYLGDQVAFKGIFKSDSKFSGFLMHIGSKKKIYEGQWKNDQMEGEGRFDFLNGKVYKGSFKQGQMDGFGQMIYQNEDRYEGLFKNNLKNGKGKITFKNGDVFQGDFVDDVMQGNGQYVWLSKDVYEGEFRNNQMCGNGKIHYKIGVIGQGIWNEGQITKIDYKTINA